MSTHDPFDTRGLERIQANNALRIKLDRDSEESDIRWLMSSKRGRRIVWRLLDQAGVFRSSFNTNAMTMSFAEGNRNYGLRVLSQVHTLCPELYPTMTKEQTNERTNDDGNSPNDT
jgi:hypothetical protein